MYIPATNVIDANSLKVEGHLYRVSLRALRRFNYFHDTLGPNGPYQGLTGSSDVYPFILLDITSTDLECLLDVLEARYDFLLFK